jgi:8-amino-7-oxononanoate synthase
VELLRYRAHAQADDLAFLYLADGVSQEIQLTYRELDHQAKTIAAWLQSRNLAGERALLLFPPGLDFISAFFGCLYAGVVAVPVYPPRRNRSMLRIQAVAQSAEASVALTSETVLERVEGLIHDTPDLKNIPWQATTQLSDDLDPRWTPPEIDENTTAFLQYTSGSTGTPKGVILTHGNMLANSRLIHMGFEHTRTNRGVFWLPCYHDMGLIGGIIQPIYCGRPNILMSPLSFLQKPYRWLSAITRYRGTTSGGPNFAYDLCVRQIKPEQLETLDLSCWKVAFNGAEPVQAETLQRFAEKFEPCGFRYEAFYPCYGLAEATLLVTGGFVEEKPKVRSVDGDALASGKSIDAIPDSDKVRKLVSSGWSVLDHEVLIVDPETRRPCSEGHVGEIWVKGPSVAQGYWKAPSETEHAFRARLATTGEGPFMRTGDLGFARNEELFVTGRIKDLIIIRGVNVYPQDIEATVQRIDSHLRINCGAAFMLEEAEKQKLVIVQEVERRFQEETAPIFEGIRRAIALEHEIAVDAIVLVKAGSIPKTSSGKIQRHACRDSYLNGSLKVIDQWSAPGASATIAKSSPPQTTEAKTAEPAKAESSDETASSDREQEEMTIEVNIGAGKNTMTSPAFGASAAGGNGNGNGHLRRSGAGSHERNASFEETAKIVFEEVERIARERAQGLELDTDITELGLDSLERMEILASLEDRFGGQFPEDILPDLLTARQVVEAVRTYLSDAPRQLRKQVSVQEIPESWYRFDQFPEYQKLRGGLDVLESTDLKLFFDVHEGTTQNVTSIDGKTYINYSSYNYLSMSGDPEVTRAAQDACQRYGTSACASRLVSGEKVIHRELEKEITDFFGTENTVTFVSGHQTNESVIGHLLGSKDMILYDSLAHNSIMQGAILSGARRRPFPHNDWEAADWLLKKHRGEYRRVMIAVEGTYSMDGDFPDLPKLIEVKKRHHALLMVDEAHSIGVLGKTGRGIGEHYGVDREDVDVWMSTLSKTLGSCGGYISGSHALVEYLKYTAPAFVFSVGLPPAAAGAALASLRILQREPERVERVRRNSALFLSLARKHGLNTGNSGGTAVIPVILGNSLLSLKISRALYQHGINVQPILHPAVEEKAARLRFFITSAHSEEEIRYTVKTLVEQLQELRRNDPLLKESAAT